MHPSIMIKSGISSLYSLSGIVGAKLARLSDSGSCILMYHRVLPKEETHAGIQPGMYVHADTFAAHLRILGEYFHVVPLEGIANPMGNRSRSSKPLCALTFDDGWLDFYLYAFPLLKEFGTPATVFLPTDYIGTGRWFWTDRLANLLFRFASPSSKAAVAHPVANRILSFRGTEENHIEFAISALKDCRLEEIETVLAELTRILGQESNSPGRAFLNWEEVRTMAASGLVAFGSHTASHRILTTLESEETMKELSASRERLLSMEAVSEKFIPFCYPNGNHNIRISELVRDAGYALAVTTVSGWNDNAADRFTLRRVPVHEDMTSTKSLYLCRITGIF